MNWTNWSGTVNCKPSKVVYPTTEEEIVNTVKDCLKNEIKLRVVGSGHSFSNLVETNGVILSLDKFKGIVSVDKDAKTATVKAGTKINEFGAELFKHGLAQENLGDIDAQSLAGSIATGTHGTGIEFGNLSTQITKIRFINGLGEIVECSETENLETFKAAQISLGALGIITELTFKLLPSYKLAFTTGKESVEAVLNNLDDYNSNNRNFEYYWFPHTDVAQTKFSNTSDKPAKDASFANYMSDMVLENYVFWLMSMSTRIMPSLSKTIAKVSAAAVSTSDKINWSHKVYALPRLVRFAEMEYNVPIDAFKDVQRDIVKAVCKYKFKVHFPLENRFVQQDDIWLSPAYDRQSAYIACHVFKGKPYKHYFKVLEEIFDNYGGRPHWGKMHTKTSNELKELYPKWNDFAKVRQVQDPNNLFLSPYMDKLLNVRIRKF